MFRNMTLKECNSMCFGDKIMFENASESSTSIFLYEINF
eukprot:UN06863